MAEQVCITCQKSQSELANALKRCGRCQQAQYCSAECQRTDWPQHKRSCPKPNNASVTQRVARATFGFQDLSEPLPDAETICFIRKTMPHLDDTTIAGPFYPRHTIVEQIMGYFHRSSQAGMNIMEELCQDDDMFGELQWIKAPLDSDSSKIMFIEILTIHDPSMAAVLPGPTYSVVSTIPMLPREVAAREANGSHSPYPRIKEMEVHGCFASVTDANRKAEEVGRGFEQGIQRSRKAGRGINKQTEGVHFTVVGTGNDNKPKAIAIEVRYDTGQIVRHT